MCSDGKGEERDGWEVRRAEGRLKACEIAFGDLKFPSKRDRIQGTHTRTPPVSCLSEESTSPNASLHNCLLCIRFIAS